MQSENWVVEGGPAGQGGALEELGPQAGSLLDITGTAAWITLAPAYWARLAGMVGLLWQAGSLLDITGTAAWITLGAGWVKIGGSVMTPERALLAVKIVHTVAWAFFAGCILAIPFFVYQDDLRTVLVLIALVMAEVLVILVNRWRCPLTDVAARYTENRADNFDIFLPLWLARYNKQIFGSIFVLDLLYALGKWQRWLP